MWICPKCGWMCFDRAQQTDDRPICPDCGTPAESDEPAISRLIREGTAGMPRRFGLVRVLGLLVVFALGFGLLRWLNAPPSVFIGVTLFVLLVGLGQAVLFGGRKPREASLVAGIVAGEVLVFVAGFLGPMNLGELLFSAVLFAFLGGLSGYLAGALVAAVFLVKGRDLEDAQGTRPRPRKGRTAAERSA